MKKNKPVTARQKALIEKWTRAGVLEQQEIAAKLDLSDVAVWKIQKQLGLRQRVPEREPLSKKTESKIIEMLRQNVARVLIARETGVSLDRIHGIARRIRFRRQRGSVGCGYGLRPPEVAAIRKALTKSEQALCKRFHISRSWLRHFRVGSFSRKRKRKR
jgi:hypothetical protein